MPDLTDSEALGLSKFVAHAQAGSDLEARDRRARISSRLNARCRPARLRRAASRCLRLGHGFRFRSVTSRTSRRPSASATSRSRQQRVGQQHHGGQFVVEAGAAEGADHQDAFRIQLDCRPQGQVGIRCILGGGKPADFHLRIDRARPGEPRLVQRVTVADDDIAHPAGRRDRRGPAVGGDDAIRQSRAAERETPSRRSPFSATSTVRPEPTRRPPVYRSVR